MSTKQEYKNIVKRVNTKKAKEVTHISQNGELYSKNELASSFYTPVAEIVPAKILERDEQGNIIRYELIQQPNIAKPEKLQTTNNRKLTIEQREYIVRLINKHGDNVNAMVIDRMLNPRQYTRGRLMKLITLNK